MIIAKPLWCLTRRGFAIVKGENKHVSQKGVGGLFEKSEEFLKKNGILIANFLDFF